MKRKSVDSFDRNWHSPTSKSTFTHTSTRWADAGTFYIKIIFRGRRIKTLHPFFWGANLSFEEIRQYVHDRLVAAGIDDFHADPLNPEGLAPRLISQIWRNVKHPLDGQRCSPSWKETADYFIECNLRSPPDPIDSKHFSLKAFVKK